MATSTQQRPLYGLLIRLLAVALLATMGAMFKLASTRGIHLMEILFWRQVASIPMLLAWAAISGGISTLATKHPKMHAKRAFYGMGGMVMGLGSLTLLPLAEATTLNFTMPIFALLLSIFIYKESVGIWRWSAVAIAFVGILIITQPGNSPIPLFGAIVGLAGAFMIALTMFQIADLGKLDRPHVIVFWFAVVSTPIYAAFVPFVHTSYGSMDLLLLIAMSIIGCFGQLLLTYAFRFASVSSVIVMDYSALFWATIYGLWIFDRLPPASTWLGAPLIVAAGLLIAWREHHLSVKQNSEPTPLKGT